MPFAYYRRLNAAQRRIYDRSDGVTHLPVPRAADLAPVAEAVATALQRDDRAGAQRAAQALVDRLNRQFAVSDVEVRVLAVRPTSHREELHGLYEAGRGRPRPLISVWMRTAQRRQVVAFRTFMRTLLHEVGHHFDYTHLRLPDSFHTQGFYKRIESLYRQVVPGVLAEGDAAPTERQASITSAKQRKESRSRSARTGVAANSGPRRAPAAERPVTPELSAAIPPPVGREHRPPAGRRARAPRPEDEQLMLPFVD